MWLQYCTGFILNKITPKNDKYDYWFRAINLSNLYIAVFACNPQSQAKLKTAKGQCQVLRIPATIKQASNAIYERIIAEIH